MIERRFHSASAPYDQDGKIYHLGAGLGDVAETVILVEDSAHLEVVTAGWDEARQVGNVRAYTVYSGVLDGRPITAGSTSSDSLGGSTTTESFARLGARSLLRIGTCTSIQPGLSIGHAVIANGAVRLDQASRSYVWPEYPAAAHPEALLALLAAARADAVPYQMGLIAAADSWYAGQELPGFAGYESPITRNLVPELRSIGVLAMDQITSTVLTIASVYGLRAAALCVVQAEHESGRFVEQSVDVIAATANRAARLLAAMDEQRQAAAARLWHPGLANGKREGTDGS